MFFSPTSPQGDGEPKAGLEGAGRRGRREERDRGGQSWGRQPSRGSRGELAEGEERTAQGEERWGGEGEGPRGAHSPHPSIQLSLYGLTCLPSNPRESVQTLKGP
ncbi:unnamed protein product, partial [Gulo gulo]